MAQVSVNDLFGSILYELPNKEDAETFVATGIALGFTADSIDIDGERVWTHGDGQPLTHALPEVLDEEAFVDLALSSEVLS